MNREEAQQNAIELAIENFRAIAVIYSQDGEEWQSGSHPEERYLETYFDAREIWTYNRHFRPVWNCYKRPGQPVDYVKETRATRKRAAQLRAIQRLRDKDATE
jgi:hypothetical protein